MEGRRWSMPRPSPGPKVSLMFGSLLCSVVDTISACRMARPCKVWETMVQ
jgi:hypothetical protein